jgi:hypothetical protein
MSSIKEKEEQLATLDSQIEQLTGLRRELEHSISQQKIWGKFIKRHASDASPHKQTEQELSGFFGDDDPEWDIMRAMIGKLVETLLREDTKK